VSVRIRLTRTGRKNLPSYRIGVFDTRTRRDGPALEVIGWFNPLSREAGKGFKLESERLDHWLRHGAVLTLAVTQLLGRQGMKIPASTAAPAKPKERKAATARKADAKARFEADPAANARRKRKLAKRASRVALRAKRAAGKAAPEAAKAGVAPAGNKE
jgi:small subunit ribosomal protein S16